MRNSDKFLSVIESLPYFDVGSARKLVPGETYLRIMLSRYSKSGRVFRLKKGIYVSRAYVDGVQKKGVYTSYLEFLASAIYESSYLSLEYVLHKCNALTEAVVNFTSVSTQKTARFSNAFGNLIYHNIKKELFVGFNISERDGFPIFEATKAKALFDYLYFRKNLLTDKGAVKELRINTAIFDKSDREEFKKYVRMEKSARLKSIGGFLFGK